MEHTLKKILPSILIVSIFLGAIPLLITLSTPMERSHTTTPAVKPTEQKSKIKSRSSTPEKNKTQSTSDNNPATSQSQLSVQPSCKNIPIPRQTEYQNDPGMPAGETRTLHKGVDGFVLTCTEYDSKGVLISKEVANVKPVNNRVARGTGPTLAQQQAAEDQALQQAAEEKARRDQSYATRLAQCKRNLGAQGVDASNADRLCRQSIQY